MTSDLVSASSCVHWGQQASLQGQGTTGYPAQQAPAPGPGPRYVPRPLHSALIVMNLAPIDPQLGVESQGGRAGLGRGSTWGCGFPDSSAGKESACGAEDLGSIPGSERSAGEGNSYPLQDSGLENSMDCTVHGGAKSRTRLSDFHSVTPCVM